MYKIRYKKYIYIYKYTGGSLVWLTFINSYLTINKNAELCKKTINCVEGSVAEPPPGRL